ncbi:MAG: AraC family transcriptional regulator [Methanomassiliicoccaceae archaeon]|nr:AraC family transcriptional regulator [Methanomassiliicoccaceae archaeon]
MAEHDKAQAVQRMQDHIEEHIGEAITLEDLSQAAGYSRSHSLRIFKEATGLTPFDYIRRCRLTEGARRLRDGNIRIADVAARCAFDTHEGFTRAFSKEFGLSPESYKEGPVPLRYFIPYSVLIRYLVGNKGDDIMEKKQKQTVFVYTAERPERKAIIKRGTEAKDYYAYCEEVGCEVWGILESVKEASYEPAGFWLPPKLIKKGTSKYVQGVEVPFDYKGVVPDGFEAIELEPCKVMVFQGEPFKDEEFEEAIGGVWEAIEKYDPKLHGFEWADADAPRFQLMPVGSRGYIEARPVKALAE